MEKELPFKITEVHQDLTWGEIGMLLLLGIVYGVVVQEGDLKSFILFLFSINLS